MRFLTARQILNRLPSQDDWYQIVNKTSDEKADVYLYDEIGIWGTTASDFISELKEIKAPEIGVHISSRGGDIFDGIAIYNALRIHTSRVTAVVDSLAASIASVITQAGDHRIMMTGSQMMIHEAHGLAMGNSADMRELADVLDKQTDNIAGIYAERAGGSGKKSHFLSLMKDTTWMNPKEAKAEGLVDEVQKPEKQVTRVEEPEDSVDWTEFIASAELEDA